MLSKNESITTLYLLVNEELRLQRVQLREELDRSRQTRSAGEQHGASRAFEQWEYALGSLCRVRLQDGRGKKKMCERGLIRVLHRKHKRIDGIPSSSVTRRK